MKSLSVLPLLTRLAQAHPDGGYRQAAVAVRAALLPGLMALWEYRDDALGRWRRLDGPHHERDHFVYGDTLAYALRGLYRSEGAGPDVRQIYARLRAMRGRGAAARYDPGIALSGYIVGAPGEADPLSAYYDIVTLGILHAVKRAVAPADYIKAEHVLQTRIARQSAIGWRMDMNLTVSGDQGDVSTLAALGEALLVPAAAPSN